MSTAETRVSVEIAGSEISFETGKMAKQASGAVVVRQGDTVVLSTATAGNLRDVDFLPLTVDVEERMYAAGKIPGSFFKREGRSGDKGTLTARMIDRPLRPLFPKGWRRETQLVTLTLSVDHIHPYDILAMNGASAALMISDIPFPTPVGAVRIGKVDGNFVINPNEEDLLSRTPTSTSSSPAPTRPSSWSRRAATRSPRPRSSTRSTSRTARSRSSARCSASWREGRQGEDGDRGPGRRRGPARRGARVARRRARRGDADLRQARAPERVRSASWTRPSRRTPAIPRTPSTPTARPPRRWRSTSSRSRSSASASRSTRSARTAAARTRSARSRSRPACCRAPTARRSSRAARRRRCRLRRSAR